MHPESEDAPSELIHDHHHPVGFEDQGLAAKEADTPQTVLGVSEKSEPGRAICARFWTVVLGQYAADDILVDRYVEDPRDLLGDPAAAEAAISPFDVDVCRNGFRS